MKRGFSVRRWIQLGFLILILLISVNHTLFERGGGIPVLSAASLHALCPFGGVVSLYQVITAGTFVKKIHESSFILMGIGIVLAIAAGPLFCGWVCPFGTVQEFLGRLGRRFFGKRYNRLLPARVDGVLRYLRYLVLVLVVIVTARSGQLLFQNIDPYFALFNFWSGEVALSAFVVLAVVLLLSLVVERPFCKYACPYGAFLGLFNKIRIFRIRRNTTTCINCSGCDRSCPMNISVSRTEVVRDHQCISCLKCTSEYACPVADTVEMMTGAFAGGEK